MEFVAAEGGLPLGPSPSLTQTAALTAASPAVAFASSVAKKSVLVVADPANTVPIYVGGSGVDNTTGAPLNANDSVRLEVANANLIYVYCASASQKARALVL